MDSAAHFISTDMYMCMLIQRTVGSNKELLENVSYSQASIHNYLVSRLVFLSNFKCPNIQYSQLILLQTITKAVIVDINIKFDKIRVSVICKQSYREQFL